MNVDVESIEIARLLREKFATGKYVIAELARLYNVDWHTAEKAIRGQEDTMSYGIGPHDTDCQCDRCQSRRKQFNLCNKRVGNSYCSLNVGHDGKCTVESLPVPATPGPWKIYDAGRDDNLFIESNGRGSVCKLARKGPDQRDRDLELANARLIAAAPELLESLKYMVAVSNWATTIQSKEQYDEMIATAEAAIRKVEGR